MLIVYRPKTMIHLLKQLSDQLQMVLVFRLPHLIVANLVRNGCRTEEPRRARFWGHAHFCIATPTILETSTTMLKNHLPHPLNLEIYGQKQGTIYSNVRLVLHPFCVSYVVTYYDVSRGGIRDKSGTYPIFSGLSRQFRDSWQLCHLQLIHGKVHAQHVL